jgi:subtilisin family serine protease
MRRTLTAALAAAGAVALVAAAAVSPASADSANGTWYYDGLGVPAAQAAGLTGSGVTIGVVDEQIKPDVPGLSGADLHVHEPSFCGTSPATSDDVNAALHTTNIAAMIVGNGTWYDGASGPKGIAPKARINVYAAADGAGEGSSISCTGDKQGAAVAGAIDQAVADGCDIITISQSQPGTWVPLKEIDAIARALHAGVIIVTSTADEPSQTDGVPFPSRANGVIGVGAFDSSVGLLTHDGAAVIDPATKVVAPGVGLLLGGSTTAGWKTTRIGSGTSFAAPITAGVLALVKQKYPKATNAQLIQSLIRNTTAEDHELGFDAKNGFGYGTVSLKHLLAVDPTQYPDVNPLISDGENELPSADDIAKAAGPTATPTPSDSATPDPATGGGSPGWLVIALVVGGIVLLLVIAGVVVAIVLATRRGRRGA